MEIHGTVEAMPGKKERKGKETGKEKEKERKEVRKEEKEKEKREKEKERDEKVGASTAGVPTTRENAPKRGKSKENSIRLTGWLEKNRGIIGRNRAKRKGSQFDNWLVLQ